MRKLATFKAPYPQSFGKMWTVDIGQLNCAITVQISRAERRKPAVGSTNIWCRRDQACLIIDREARALGRTGFDNDNFVVTIEIHINQTRRKILENPRLGQAHRYRFARISHNLKRAKLNGIAQNPMRIPRCWL